MVEPILRRVGSRRDVGASRDIPWKDKARDLSRKSRCVQKTNVANTGIQLIVVVVVVATLESRNNHITHPTRGSNSNDSRWEVRSTISSAASKKDLVILVV
jgi:hypothetical protein